MVGAGRGSKEVLPVCSCPRTISVARRPLVTLPSAPSSMRPLSKYCTRRAPPAASLYGSIAPSRALASGPQKFGVTLSLARHWASKAGDAKTAAALPGPPDHTRRLPPCTRADTAPSRPTATVVPSHPSPRFCTRLYFRTRRIAHPPRPGILWTMPSINCPRNNRRQFFLPRRSVQASRPRRTRSSVAPVVDRQ